jgi:hypothetical protein
LAFVFQVSTRSSTNDRGQNEHPPNRVLDLSTALSRPHSRSLPRITTPTALRNWLRRTHFLIEKHLPRQSVHHIIRKREEDTKVVTYRLVGEAVIYNCMNGELDLKCSGGDTILASQDLRCHDTNFRGRVEMSSNFVPSHSQDNGLGSRISGSKRAS